MIYFWSAYRQAPSGKGAPREPITVQLVAFVRSRVFARRFLDTKRKKLKSLQDMDVRG